jgi:PAS domain S-box-containing protein
MLAVERTALQNNRFADFVSPDDLDAFRRHLDEARRSGTRNACEIRLLRSNRSFFYGRLETLADLDAEGEALQWRTAIMDITDRRLAEEALQKSRQQYKTLADNAPDVIARFDRHLRYVYVNPVSQPIMGFPPDHYLGKTISQAGASEAVVSLWEEGLRDVFRLGSTRTLDFQDEVQGRPRFFHARLVPEYSAGGLVGHVLAVIRDVTQEREADRRIRETGEQYRRIVETTNEGIWTVDAHNRFTFANSRMGDMLGVPAAELAGRCLEEFLDPDMVEPYHSRWESRKKGHRDTYEMRLRRQDGQPLWGLISATPLFDDERCFAGVLAMVTDITERKRAEEAIRLSEERYRTLFEHMAQGVLYRSPRTRHGRQSFAERYWG